MQEAAESQEKGVAAAASPATRQNSPDGILDDSPVATKPKRSGKRKAEGRITLKPTKRVEKVLLLEDILEKNGEADLFDKIMLLADTAEDDPPLIFGWEKVEKFVAAIKAARAGVPAPPLPPFPIPANITVRDFKLAVLNHVRRPGAAPPLGTSVLPCTQAQFCQGACELALLCMHPWTRHIVAQGGADILPIATVCVPRPRSNRVDHAVAAIANLWR